MPLPRVSVSLAGVGTAAAGFGAGHRFVTPSLIPCLEVAAPQAGCVPVGGWLGAELGSGGCTARRLRPPARVGCFTASKRAGKRQ